MSKAYLQGFYDYFVGQWENPFFDQQDIIDWQEGYNAGRKAGKDC